MIEMSSLILTNDALTEQPRIVRRELNFDFGQLFYPNEKRKIFDIRYFRSGIKNRDEQIVKATIAPHAILGTLTTFDERTYYALVELWEESTRLSEVLFSEREIARRLCLGWGKCTAKAITESLARLRLVSIQWEESYFYQGKKQTVGIIQPFTILNHLKITSTKDEAFKAQIAEFSFDKKVLENLNSNYSRPVRFDVVLSFQSPLAQAVYNHLDRKLYGTKEYNRTTQGLLIEDLSLLAKSYSRKAIRHQELRGIVNQLTGKPTAFGEVIEVVELDSKRDLFKVLRSGSSTSKVKVAKPEKLIERPTAPPEPLPTKPIQEPTKEPSEATQAIAHFRETFASASPINNEKALQGAEKAIKSYGLTTIKKLIDYAFQEAEKTNYEPKHFSGIQKYFDEGLQELKNLEAYEKRNAEQEQQIRAKHLENARNDHERKYEQTYFEFVNEIVESLIETNPEAIARFKEWQDEERAKFESMKEGIRATALRFFDKEGQIIQRLWRFFKDDSEVKILDFWEWDKLHNPQSKPFLHSKKI